MGKGTEGVSVSVGLHSFVDVANIPCKLETSVQGVAEVTEIHAPVRITFRTAKNRFPMHQDCLVQVRSCPFVLGKGVQTASQGAERLDAVRIGRGAQK